MKNRIVFFLFALFGLLLVGACTGDSGPSETRWKGEALKVEAAPAPRLPEWRVYVLWKQLPQHARDKATFTIAHYDVSQREKPTLLNFTPPPFEELGESEVVRIWGVDLLYAGDPLPEPTLPDPKEPKHSPE